MLQDQSVSSCFMLLIGTGSSVVSNSASKGSMVSSFTCTAMTSKGKREGEINTGKASVVHLLSVHAKLKLSLYEQQELF